MTFYRCSTAFSLWESSHRVSCQLASRACNLNESMCIQYDGMFSRSCAIILRGPILPETFIFHFGRLGGGWKTPRKTATLRRLLTVYACEGNPNGRSPPAPGTARAFQQSSPGSDPRPFAHQDRWSRIGGGQLRARREADRTHNRRKRFHGQIGSILTI
jgi:hypothetical protein